MDWKKGIVDGLSIIGVMGLGVIAVMIILVVTLIITGILNDTVVPALNLGAGTTGNITNVTTAVFNFVGSLTSGLGIVGALVLIAIVIAVFAGIGILGYNKFKGSGNKEGGNF